MRRLTYFTIRELSWCPWEAKKYMLLESCQLRNQFTRYLILYICRLETAAHRGSHHVFKMWKLQQSIREWLHFSTIAHEMLVRTIGPSDFSICGILACYVYSERVIPARPASCTCSCTTRHFGTWAIVGKSIPKQETCSSFEGLVVRYQVCSVNTL